MADLPWPGEPPASGELQGDRRAGGPRPEAGSDHAGRGTAAETSSWGVIDGVPEAGAVIPEAPTLSFLLARHGRAGQQLEKALGSVELPAGDDESTGRPARRGGHQITRVQSQFFFKKHATVGEPGAP